MPDDGESESRTGHRVRKSKVGRVAAGGTRKPGVDTMKGHDHTNDRAMTPVIGIVLLIAITVLLAGTAGAFFFGFADDTTELSQPQTTIQFEDTISGGSDTVTVKHLNGESVEADNLYVRIDGARCSGGDNPNGRYNVDDDFGFPAEKMSAGMTVQVGKELGPGGTTICSGSDLDLTDATVTVTWDSGESKTRTYASWEYEG